MPGLLAELDGIDLGASIGPALAEQGGALGAVAESVRGLIEGNAPLDALLGAIGNMPLPPGLDALAALGPAIQAVATRGPTEPAALVAPMVAPLTRLASGGLSVSVRVDIGALLAVVRETMRLVSGVAPGGAQGMPDGPGGLLPFRTEDFPDFDQLRAALAEARTVLDGLGPKLDLPKLLALLRGNATGVRTPSFRWPPMPLFDEVFEALAETEAWRSMNGAALSARLAETLGLAARVIALPRDRVATPLLAACTTLAAAPATLDDAARALPPLLSSLRARTQAGEAAPTGNELALLSRHATALEALAEATGAIPDDLAGDLTAALLTTLRALSPAVAPDGLAGTLDGFIARIPAAPPDPLAPLVTAVQDFDIASIAGPFQAVRQAVTTAQQEITAAQQEVRDALTAALTPVAEALDAALEGARLTELKTAIGQVPAAITNFMDNEVAPALNGVKTAAQTAIDAVETASTEFDPQRLLAPIREALEQLAALLSRPEVSQTITAVRDALAAAAEVLAAFDMAPAADESIAILGRIQVKLEGIDPALIPDEVKPQLRQAVAFVTDIDFAGQVAGPIVATVTEAVAAGPGAVLGALEGEMDALGTKLAEFDPAQLIGPELDKPFQDLAATLRGFRPGDLFTRAQAALDEAAQGIGVLDPASAIAPVAAAHATASEAVARLRPSLLLKPVEDAAEDAIATLFREAHIDDALAGITGIAEALTGLLGLAREAGALLDRAALLVTDLPAPADEAERLVQEASAKLDSVTLARLRDGFAATAAAVAAIAPNLIASDLAAGLRAAAAIGPALAGPAVGQLDAALAALPQAALAATRQTASTRQLVGLLDRLRRATARLAAAPRNLGQRCGTLAGTLQERLVDYTRLMDGEGQAVLAGFTTLPTTKAQLRAAVEESLRATVQAPLETFARAVQAIAPYLAGATRGIAALVVALEAKLSAVLGDAGLAGAAQGITEIADELRDLDLTPVTGPLDALHARITTALDALDPAPITAALEAARDALADAAQLARLLDPADIAAIDTAWQTVVDRIEALSPGRLVADTLSPPYRTAVAAVAPVLELPGILRELTEAAGRDLGAEVTAELVRVEAAFDAMLRAIPLQDAGGPGASASASVSVEA
jgi:hypothetical protein